MANDRYTMESDAKWLKPRLAMSVISRWAIPELVGNCFFFLHNPRVMRLYLSTFLVLPFNP
jgi:hypothetical protein